jgi:hypothetical protein
MRWVLLVRPFSVFPGCKQCVALLSQRNRKQTNVRKRTMRLSNILIISALNDHRHRLREATMWKSDRRAFLIFVIIIVGAMIFGFGIDWIWPSPSMPAMQPPKPIVQTATNPKPVMLLISYRANGESQARREKLFFRTMEECDDARWNIMWRTDADDRPWRTSKCSLNDARY